MTHDHPRPPFEFDHTRPDEYQGRWNRYNTMAFAVYGYLFVAIGIGAGVGAVFFGAPFWFHLFAALMIAAGLSAAI